MENIARPNEDAIAEQRAERFGVLPPRVRPGDVIGSVETRRAEGRPAAAPSEEQHIVQYAAG